MTGNNEHSHLRARLGEHLYRQRMNIQAHHTARVIGQGRTLFHPENAPLLRGAIRAFLRLTFLYKRGRANARRIQVREHRAALPRLPDAFTGYRVLHLSDLHLDIDPGITSALIAAIERTRYDLCVITGDFRAECDGDFEPALEETARVMAILRPPVYAVLGNHDYLEMTAPLEAMGMRVLLNEHAVIRRGEAALHLAGIDDPHFYEGDNFEKALAGVPPEETTILLSHSAEPYRQAMALGVDLMLCGHTHGGQICLPGGFALMHNAQHPRRMIRGPWRYLDMLGYTSRGAGCSMVPVRYFCPAEITVHVLERAPSPGPPRDALA